MKLSFDEEYRRAMNELGKGWDGVRAAMLGSPVVPRGRQATVTPSRPTGGLQAVAELLQVDYEMHKMTSDPLNLALRRYAGMALTNLTFGDVVNKVCGAEGVVRSGARAARGSAHVSPCRQRCAHAGAAWKPSWPSWVPTARSCTRWVPPGWMGVGMVPIAVMVPCPHAPCAPLTQVVSSILRNLSWRADINSKKVLREVGSVAGLTQCALHAAKVRFGAGGGGHCDTAGAEPPSPNRSPH